MKTLSFIIAAWLAFFIIAARPLCSQAQGDEGYTFIGSTTGTLVCMGRWIPSTDVALPGACSGQLVDIAQFTAISSRLSAERLDQLLFVLGSIDQKLSVNNEQMERLIEATVNTRISVDEQVSQVGELLRETIAEKFEALPGEMLSGELFREQLTKLKEDILKEVEKHYLPRQAPPAK
jgi:hypothetical protein